MKRLFIFLSILFLSFNLFAENTSEVPRYKGFAIGGDVFGQFPIGDYSQFANASLGVSLAGEYTFPLNLPKNMDLGAGLHAEYGHVFPKSNVALKSDEEIRAFANIWLRIPFRLFNQYFAFQPEVGGGISTFFTKYQSKETEKSATYISPFISIAPSIRWIPAALQNLEVELAPVFTIVPEKEKSTNMLGLRLGAIWHFETSAEEKRKAKETKKAEKARLAEEARHAEETEKARQEEETVTTEEQETDVPVEELEVEPQVEEEEAEPVVEPEPEPEVEEPETEAIEELVSEPEEEEPEIGEPQTEAVEEPVSEPEEEEPQIEPQISEEEIESDTEPETESINEEENIEPAIEEPETETEVEESQSEPLSEEEEKAEPVLEEEETTPAVEEESEEYTPTSVRLGLKNILFFSKNGAVFSGLSRLQIAQNERTIDEAVALIKEHPDCHVLIEGYANNISGTEKEDRTACMPLSLWRAEYIKKELIKRGIKAEQIETVGRGGANPLAGRKDRDNWWKNRRVEFVITY